LPAEPFSIFFYYEVIALTVNRHCCCIRRPTN